MQDAPQYGELIELISWCSPLWDRGLPQGCAGIDSRSNRSPWRNAAGGPRQPQGGLQVKAASLPGTCFQHHSLDLLPVRCVVHTRPVGTGVPLGTAARELRRNLGAGHQRDAEDLACGR